MAEALHLGVVQQQAKSLHSGALGLVDGAGEGGLHGKLLLSRGDRCCCTALDGVGGLTGTDIGTAGAVAVPRWSLDADNASHTFRMKHCHPCRGALKRAVACWPG
jgi:hypothetical protein